MADYEALRVWHLAHELALDVYSATLRFPRAESYGLTSQMRRAATSIPANLAEGCGRDTDRELARFARIALGSANELDYYVRLGRDLNYLAAAAAGPLRAKVSQVRAMLFSLARAVTRPRSAAPMPTTEDLRPTT